MTFQMAVGVKEIHPVHSNPEVNDWRSGECGIRNKPTISDVEGLAGAPSRQKYTLPAFAFVRPPEKP